MNHNGGLFAWNLESRVDKMRKLLRGVAVTVVLSNSIKVVRNVPFDSFFANVLYVFLYPFFLVGYVYYWLTTGIWMG